MCGCGSCFDISIEFEIFVYETNLAFMDIIKFNYGDRAKHVLLDLMLKSTFLKVFS